MVDVGVIRVNSRGRCRRGGCAIITVFVPPMLSSIMRRVYAASKVYFIIVLMRKGVHPVRTILADVAPKSELPVGVVWPRFHVFFRVYGVTGHCSVVNVLWKRVTRDTPGRGAVAGLYSLLPKKGCWTQPRTFSARLSYSVELDGKNKKLGYWVMRRQYLRHS